MLLGETMKTIKYLKSRGFTDRLYVINFIAVHIIVASVVILTALSGTLNITDMTALAAIPPCSYAELGVHTGFVIWKAKAENMNKHGMKENIMM